jgi:hypothetical protein
MKNVLVDSSVWIEYFRGNPAVAIVDDLIDQNQICINDLILAELVPFLRMKKEHELIGLLRSIRTIELDIGWEEIIKFQEMNLRNGINKVGIPDLILVQNVRDNGLELYSLDKHFSLMSAHIDFRQYQY